MSSGLLTFLSLFHYLYARFAPPNDLIFYCLWSTFLLVIVEVEDHLPQRLDGKEKLEDAVEITCVPNVLAPDRPCIKRVRFYRFFGRCSAITPTCIAESFLAYQPI